MGEKIGIGGFRDDCALGGLMMLNAIGHYYGLIKSSYLCVSVDVTNWIALGLDVREKGEKRVDGDCVCGSCCCSWDDDKDSLGFVCCL